VKSLLGAILLNEVILFLLFLVFICCRSRVGIPNKVFCLGRSFGSIIIDLVSISCRSNKVFCFITCMCSPLSLFCSIVSRNLQVTQGFEVRFQIWESSSLST
jgi:hypothetical protein